MIRELADFGLKYTDQLLLTGTRHISSQGESERKEFGQSAEQRISDDMTSGGGATDSVIWAA